MQAGWEQGITNVLAGLAGLNMCYEAVGMHASLLGFCWKAWSSAMISSVRRMRWCAGST